MTTPPAESTHLFEASDLRGAVLGPLSLSMDAGECVTLAGPSGAGKSLLLRALADLDPREGDVCLQGVPRERMPPTQWRRQVGYLPADAAWWADTVGEHLPEGGDAWLQRLGFETAVRDWSVERLSSGERARLALVRLLMNTPRVLLLDEPTANLDGNNTRRVESLILDYLREHAAACLWVSHDPEQRTRLGGRMLHIRDGRLQESAS